MLRLEDLVPGTVVGGLLFAAPVTVVQVQWHGDTAVTLTYRTAEGVTRQQLLYRADEQRLSLTAEPSAYTFDGDGRLLRLGLEAMRIRYAYLFDPFVAVHSSRIEPLPHQIEAVYNRMLPCQPLRFLLADDPGAGKTIMAGLLIRELIIRGDLKRCLVVTPGSLAEQWQDEMSDKFGLAFDIFTRETIEASRTGNPFFERDLVIARLDHLARNDDLTAKLDATEWDLVVVDEAHKMSAHYNGDKVVYTKRYRLGQQLGKLTRHLLLMTATPHSGKEADFHLFMALLDEDRFAGKPRQASRIDVSDMMRRLIKEDLLTFEGKPLFPERRAYTVHYELSPEEAALYHQVTEYVRTEMNRADRLKQRGEGRRGTVVGFALTMLQRRLASSPAAITTSLERRRARLEKLLAEARQAGRRLLPVDESRLPGKALVLSDEDWSDIDEELPDEELEDLERAVLDEVTAAQTVEELETEIASLRRLEEHARRVRASNSDAKWQRFSELLTEEKAMRAPDGSRRKLIVFTEHRDTLEYLASKIRTLLGREEEVVTIHGGMPREHRRVVQERFTQDDRVSILVATDAAGEGINLQRAHLLINYDLPWNPNRIEQRFGRVHRIGQTEVCHMWNLVAKGTREGHVFERLFDKLEKMRAELKGQVYDVLGQVFIETPLRELIVEAIRYGDRPEVRSRLDRVIDAELPQRVRAIVHERAIASDVMTVEDVIRERERMQIAEARKLQPYFIESFFAEAFRMLGGSIAPRERGRYQIARVPSYVRQHRSNAMTRSPILPSYERVTFDRDKIAVAGAPTADLLAPGHPLLDAVTALTLEHARETLQSGAVLVDDQDADEQPRLLFAIEHSVHDARLTATGQPRLVSRRLQFVEMKHDGSIHDAGYAPHLDYRPAADEEQELLAATISNLPFARDAETAAVDWAIQNLAPQHLAEVSERTLDRVERMTRAVRDRLTREISYWDRRAEQLKERELAGKAPRGGVNSGIARNRAKELQDRLKARMAELERERELASAPPIVHAAAVVIPAGLLRSMNEPTPIEEPDPSELGLTRQEVERIAVAAVLATERLAGREPREMPPNNPGYDVVSRDPATGDQLFIEVKGRVEGATTVTVSRNEILTALNKGADYILAIVIVGADRSADVQYVPKPFVGDPTIIMGSKSVNLNLVDMLKQSFRPGASTAEGGFRYGGAANRVVTGRDPLH